MIRPNGNTDGLFYSASDARGVLRCGWISSCGDDCSSLDAWIEALQTMKEQTPDIHLYMVRLQRFSDFQKFASNAREAVA